MKRPAFQFYPSDWRKDTALQLCSITARGLWWEMICVMHECVPYGHLALNGVAMPDANAARLMGAGISEYKRSVTELERSRIFSRTADGIIYSRRMVRDEELRNIRAAGGARGAEHGAKGKEHGQKGGRPSNERGDKKPPLSDITEPPLKPPPSSSSSSSSSEEKQKRESRAKRAPARAPKTPPPEGFAISDRVKRWAAEKGHDRLAERFEHFMGKARMNGYAYADWDEALMTAIREDWAELSGKSVRDEAAARRLQGARNMDILTGKTDGRRTINGTAERVDRPAFLALPGDVREPDADDVEGRGPDGSQGPMGGGTRTV